MTTVTFNLEDDQEAKANKTLAERQAGDPSLTLDEMCRLETVYALGLSQDQMVQAVKTEVAAKLAVLTKESLAKVAALVEAEVAKAEPVDVGVISNP